MIEGIMPVGNLNVPVIGANVPTAQLAEVAQAIGPLFNRVVLAPLGAADIPRMHAVFAACAGKYPVHLGPGNWGLDSDYYSTAPEGIPSNTKMIWEPGAALISTVAANGSGTNFPLYAAAVAGTATYITAIPVVYSRTMLCHEALTIGSYFKVTRAASSNLDGDVFKVIACSGASAPYTITVDHDIRRTYAASDVVTRLTSIPHDIQIIGSPGATLSGTGDGLIKIVGGLNISIDGLVVTPDSGNHSGIGVYFNFCRNVTVRDSRLDGRGVTTGVVGFAANSCEDITFAYCHSDNYGTAAGAYGFGVWSCIAPTLEMCFAQGNYDGTSISCGGASESPCMSATVLGGEYSHNQNIGISVEDGAVGARLIGCHSCNNGSGAANIFVANTCKTVVMHGVETSGGGWGIWANGDTMIDGWTGSGSVGGGAFLTQSGSHRLSHCDLSVPTASASNTIAGISGASHIRLTACRLTNSGAGVYQVSLTVSGSTLQRTDVENVGTAGTESLGAGATKLDAQYA